MLPAELASEEVVGISALSMFAKGLYGDIDVGRAPLERTRRSASTATRRDVLLLSLHLPFTTRGDVQLGRTDR